MRSKTRNPASGSANGGRQHRARWKSISDDSLPLPRERQILPLTTVWKGRPCSWGPVVSARPTISKRWNPARIGFCRPGSRNGPIYRRGDASRASRSDDNACRAWILAAMARTYSRSGPRRADRGPDRAGIDAANGGTPLHASVGASVAYGVPQSRENLLLRLERP